MKCQIKIPIIFPDGIKINAQINIRPYAQQVLSDLSQFYEIIIFTASHSSYANAVLDHLDPSKTIISHRLFRESCILTNDGVYVKDLRIINRKLENMLLIDNAGYSFAFQIENGVPILNYYDDSMDTELLELSIYLKSFLNCKDMREMNNRCFQFKTVLDLNSIQDQLKNIYQTY